MSVVETVSQDIVESYALLDRLSGAAPLTDQQVLEVRGSVARCCLSRFAPPVHCCKSVALGADSSVT